jgi:predicted dehydrogenase
MTRTVRWGVLGAANIALKKVIPAMQRSRFCEVAGIATRSANFDALRGLGTVYDDYDALLRDPSIEAIYNPLPNHLHVPWTIRAADAGKHVLCEKPIGMHAREVRQLIQARDRRGVRIAEAFMTRLHPQWLRSRELVRSGAIGELKAVDTVFSYFNRQAANIRNRPEFGGGALMDIGCYAVTMSRFLFDAEPRTVAARIERDPEFQIDRLTSGVLEFPGGHAVFTCSTQMTPYQVVQIFGTTGRIEIEIPFNAPPDRPTRIFVNGAPEEFPTCDQYTLQADHFAQAIWGETELAVPLEDSLANMQAIDALFRSAEIGASVSLDE